MNLPLIPPWIPVTIAAAFFQVWRTALQARLRKELPASATSFARYVYALPLDAILLVGVTWWLGAHLPALPSSFLALSFLGGFAQIIGTILLITAFSLRNFVVGTAYAKTEAAQLVLVSVVLLGVHLPALAIAGIVIAVMGVLSLSFVGQRLHIPDLLKASVQPAALAGLGAGFAFAMTALALRAASFQLPPSTPVTLKALLLLLVTNSLQTLTQGAYMVARQRDQLRACFRAWRKAGPVGILSALGSWGWFTGFALTQVAMVRGLGQIEMVFAFLFGSHFLKEGIRWQEIIAVLVVVLGVLMVTIAGLH